MNEIYDSIPSRYIKFSLLILLGIPSAICALYVIYNFIRIPSFRIRFQNQILVIIVFVVLLNIIFNIPISMSFFARGRIWPDNEVFCNIWQTIDYIFTACTIWCKAIFTIERYILVFCPNSLRSQRQKLIFHYIPIILLNLYLILFYIFSTIFYQCSHHYDYNRHLCGEQCLDRDGTLATFNWLFNILLPVFIIIFGSLILLLRVLWTRREMQRNLRNWSKNSKMIIQLLGIAGTYTIVWLPLSVVTLIEVLSSTNLSIEIIVNHLYFLTYISHMSTPILALFLSPEIKRRFHQRLRLSVIDLGSATIGQYSTN